jgi:hypothetical protein
MCSVSTSDGFVYGSVIDAEHFTAIPLLQVTQWEHLQVDIDNAPVERIVDCNY